MATKSSTVKSSTPKSSTPKSSTTKSGTSRSSTLKRYENGQFRFAGEDYYDRHLVFDHAVAPEDASQRERFEAVSRSLRDLLTQRWLLTQRTQDRANPK